jgi:hypothetical protein
MGEVTALASALEIEAGALQGRDAMRLRGIAESLRGRAAQLR